MSVSISLTCNLDCTREGKQKNIWKNNGQIFSKFDENHKPYRSKSTMNTKQNKCKENHIMAPHNKVAEYQHKI